MRLGEGPYTMTTRWVNGYNEPEYQVIAHSRNWARSVACIKKSVIDASKHPKLLIFLEMAKHDEAQEWLEEFLGAIELVWEQEL